jgi:hypothetical protein
LWRLLWSLRGRSSDHQLETLLGGRELWDVVVGVSASNVLLHRAIPLLLLWVVSDLDMRSESEQITPMHLLRQAEPSWLLRGQITSFSASVETRNEPVPNLGGIACDEERRKEKSEVAAQTKMTVSASFGAPIQRPGSTTSNTREFVADCDQGIIRTLLKLLDAIRHQMQARSGILEGLRRG